MAKKHTVITETEFSIRPHDRKVARWQRASGKFGWNPWVLVDVRHAKEIKLS